MRIRGNSAAIVALLMAAGTAAVMTSPVMANRSNITTLRFGVAFSPFSMTDPDG
jgi:hypothetical protein